MDGDWPDLEITFESGDGHGRNTDYKEGVLVALERLRSAGATLQGASISGTIVRRAVEHHNVDPSFSPKELPLPMPLIEVDLDVLRHALGDAGALVNGKPNSSGSSTRKMTLKLHLSSPAISADFLEKKLATGATAPLELELLADVVDVDNAMAIWASALEAGSRPARGRLRYLPSEAVSLDIRSSSGRNGALDVKLGVRSTQGPWTVEIDAPGADADANSLSALARDAAGGRYLVRQGWLPANPDSNGEIRDERFRTLANLKPVQVSGGSTPTPREWYVVAEIDTAPAIVQLQTAIFVHACALARAASRQVAGNEPQPKSGGAEQA